MPCILITGAGGGIGRALVPLLTREWPDHRLILVGRDRARLEVVAPADAVVHPADTSDEAQVATLGPVIEAHGPLAGIAHLAGSLLLKPLHRTSFADWRATQAASLDSAFLVTRLAVERMLAQSSPVSVVLMSSVAARLGLPNHEAIAAAKGGVEGLVRAAAATYADKGFRCNAVAPGLTVTPLTQGLVSTPAAQAASTAMHPLGRLGTPEDQASAIAWLLSPASSWVTGQVIGVDGGLGVLRRR